MAAALPTGPQHGQMQMDPSASSSREPIPQLSWEGDKMFNIYIFDYCTKRGFKKTARELMIEADLGSDAAPPINARQGLLFEWWSVFWVLFQAKSGNANQEDASLYIQHQNAQKAAAQRLQGAPPPGQQQQSGAPMPLGNQPQQPPSNPQPQPPVNRMSNGMPMQRQAPGYHANGSMPNGISPAMGGQPAHLGQVGPQGMQGQPGAPMNFVGMGGQPNGLPGPQQGIPQQQGTQSMPFNPMMGGGSAQRPPMNGQPQQPGQQQAGRGPFTSPPMAHSPQGGAGGQPAPQGPQPGQPGQQAPMAQLGPSPHLNRTMLPPPSTGVGGQMNPPPGGLQTPAFTPGPMQGPQGQQGPTGGRPPSRTRPSPSPSMSARQPPGPPGPAQQQAGMGMMGGMMSMGGIPMPGMGGINVGGLHGGMGVLPGPNQDINQEFSHISLSSLTSLKHELGFGDKDLNMNDKARIVSLWRSRNAGQQQQQRKDSAPGPIQGGMLPPQVQGSQQQQQRAGPQQPQMQPGASTNRLKRNSSSPGDENDTLTRTESSPPERKRAKRSPPEQPAIPSGPYPQHLPGQQPPSGSVPPGTAQSPASQQGPVQPQTPQHPGQPGTAMPQQMMTQQMFMRQLAMSGNGPNPGGQGQAGPGSLVQQPPNPSVQAAMGMQMHLGHMQPPQQPTLFRPGAPPGPSGPPAAPTVPPPGFNTTPLTRLGQPTKLSAVGMVRTPPPGMNGPPKDVAKGKSNGQSQASAQQQGPEASPRNAPAGTAPPTPGPSTQTAPGMQPGGGSATQTPGPVSQPPGVSSMLGMSVGMPGMNAGDLSMFEPGFMAGMEEFVPDGDLNFERDFGQWFNSTEDGSVLDS